LISNLLIQIIHYSKLSDRKEFIDKLFKDENLEIDYVLDYDKEALNTAPEEYNYVKNEDQFLGKIIKLWKIYDEKYRILSDAELSCYFKHLKSLYNIANSDKEYGLILEDDVINLKPIKNNLHSVINKFSKTDWDIVFLGRGAGKDFIKSKSKKDLFNLKYLKPTHPASNCAEAYIIKKKSAGLLYESMKEFTLPYDWEMAYKMFELDFKVRWYYPPLFKQGSQDNTYKSELR
jgi:GR25 family glycosyltransferase involved in LPS biosynthesis|tara:strand:+ start:2075 stop:2773 length:699 start_codon:yes stop_codon:yes gene_type:complete